MKKMRLIVSYIMLLLFCLIVLGVENVDAGVNDFYFSDFTGDYYLSEDTEGISHLKVKESVTAVFPDYDQNKGICRQIAFTNQNGSNLTLPNLTRANMTLTRNGEVEPIYSIEKEGNYYEVCTGTDDYLHGEQTYVFEYEFEKVVTDFGDYQELYWDTNGNGARQRFDKVTARVHFVDDVLASFTGESWCYVGKYGASGQDRCKMTKLDDGMEFVAENLKSYENLTFDVELKAGSFVVPGPIYNYTYVWLATVVGILCIIWTIWMFVRFIRSRDKAKYYKGIFVKPEYQPNKDYDLTEMAEIYIGKKKDMKVAMLLKLVVDKKIEFQKTDKKKWNLLVKNLDGVGKEYLDLLAILNDGTQPEVGDVVEMKSRTANSRLVALKKAMENEILRSLKQDQLVEEKYRIGGSNKRGVANVIAMTIVIVPIIIMIGLFIMSLISDVLDLNTEGKIIVFEREFYIVALIMIVLTVAISVALSDAAQKYAKHTELGLMMSRYMDGLKLYIEMAEADRMKMLQSVKGADTSAEGIVKLYEKLLPYAAVFGLEESWMNEMKEYCKVKEIEEPEYLLMGITVSELSRVTRTAAGYASTATVMSNSGGGSSSGFSGGGGGGFSGGGGGGGGFSGR